MLDSVSGSCFDAVLFSFKTEDFGCLITVELDSDEICDGCCEDCSDFCEAKALDGCRRLIMLPEVTASTFPPSSSSAEKEGGCNACTTLNAVFLGLLRTIPVLLLPILV